MHLFLNQTTPTLDSEDSDSESVSKENIAKYLSKKIKKELINGDDDLRICEYLGWMIAVGDYWPDKFKDVDVFNKNPSELFDSQTSNFVVVKRRTEDCGKTDGCESGCWRVIGRDKLVKWEETGNIIGFKKILKFCKKTKPREYKRTWVMEEYRVVSKWNSKQDHVICKIRLLFQAEISSLLANHFSYLSTTRSVPIPSKIVLPAYGFYSLDLQEEGAYYMKTIMRYDGKNYWPSYVTNNVYRLHPLTLVDPEDKKFKRYGTCIFVNRTKTCGISDECDGGDYWRIIEGYSAIKSRTGKVLGYKRVFTFWENEEPRNVSQGKGLKEFWTIEEYRLFKDVMQNKVLCVIKKSYHYH